MKKFISALAILTFSVAIATAQDRKVGTPVSQTGATLQSADYGGVDISTAGIFSSTRFLIFQGEGVWNGITLSTGLPEDHIKIYDSTSATAGHGWLIGTVYNVSNSTLSPSGISWKPPYPIHVRQGLAAVHSNATTNSVGVLYNKFNK